MPKNKKLKSDPASIMGSFSKNLLGLKFMQRSKKEAEKKLEEKDESFDTSLCNKMKNKQQYIMNPSYQFCESLRFGRFSFKGMNPEIEVIMFNNKTASEKDITPIKKRPVPIPESSSDNEIDNLESDDEEEDVDESLTFE